MTDIGTPLLTIGDAWLITSRGLVRLHDAAFFPPEEIKRRIKEKIIIGLISDPAVDPEITVTAIAAATAIHDGRLWRTDVGLLIRHMLLEQERRQEQADEELREALGAGAGKAAGVV
ncbi:MAG: hypothetical protein ACR652_23070 [Methylocystis sp.]|uniref:hypothetical protein n=1 Tax=Methylocystis sp. TaxID=1911079 RepID=UPI003DA3E3FA